MNTLYRIVVGLLLASLHLSAFSQLTAWTQTYGQNEQTHNEDMFEAMISVPGGDTIVAGYVISLTGPTLWVHRMGPAGELKWSRDLGGWYPTQIRLVVAGPYVHVLANNWNALNLSDGHIFWQNGDPGAISYAAHPDGSLYALSVPSGVPTLELLQVMGGDATWSVAVDTNLTNVFFVKSDPEGNAFVGGSYKDESVSNGFGIQKVAPNGSPGWIAAAGYESFPPVPDKPGDAAFFPAGNAMYVTARQNYNSYDDDFSVTKFDLTTGAKLWNRMFDSGGAPDSGKFVKVLTDGSVVAVSTSNRVVRIAPNGTVMWSTAGLSATGEPYGFEVDSKNRIFVGVRGYGGGREDYAVWRLDPATGIGDRFLTHDSGGIDIPTGLCLAADGNPIVNGSIRSSGFRAVRAVKFQQMALACNPSTVVGGQSSTVSLTLTGLAIPGGYRFALSSNNPSVASPTTSIATLVEGAGGKAFTVATQRVAVTTTVTIYATHPTGQISTQITVVPALLQGLEVTPVDVVGGEPAQGVVTFSGPAPSGGIGVLLADNSTSVSTDGVCLVVEGASSGTFGITTIPVVTPVDSLIYAHFGSITKTDTLRILPPSLISLSVPAYLYGGSAGTGAVSLNGKAPVGNWSIAISDNSAFMSVPSSTAVPAGATVGSFNILTSVVTTTINVVITAKRGSTTKTATVSVRPPIVSSFSILPDAVTGGQTTTGLIMLSSSAPPGGLTVAIQNGAPSKVTTPSSLYIPAGATSRSFLITTKAVPSQLVVSVHATLNGTTVTRYIYLLP